MRAYEEQLIRRGMLSKTNFGFCPFLEHKK